MRPKKSLHRSNAEYVRTKFDVRTLLFNHLIDAAKNYPSETLIRQFIILRCVNLKFSRGVLLFNAFFGKTLVRQSCAWRREHVFCCCPSSLSRSVRPFVHSYTHNMVRTETEMLWQNRQKNKDPRKTRSRARSAWFFKDIIIH